MSRVSTRLDKVSLEIVQVRRKLRVFKRVLPAEAVELERRLSELLKEYKQLKQEALDKIDDIETKIKQYKATKRNIKKALSFADKELSYE